MTPAKPIQTSPFPSVARESAKAWGAAVTAALPTSEEDGHIVDRLMTKVEANRRASQIRTQAEPLFPEREAAGKATTALRDEVRGWLGDVKPSERLSQIICDPGSDHPADRLDALENYLDEIWTRAQGSK